MRKRAAFTILELLIALLISGFIFVILSQNLRHAMRFLTEGGEASRVDRTVCLLFDRLDRDLSGVYIPEMYSLPEKEEAEKEGEKKKEVKPEQKRVEHFFVTKVQEDPIIKFGEKKRELFESLSFITRNPIQIYGHGKKRYARVMYELLENRDKSRESVVYDLIRKETEDLANDELKEAEEGVKVRKSEIVWRHEVARNVKEFYIEYGSEKKKKEGEDKQKREYSYRWEDEDRVPQVFKVRLVLWNLNQSKEYTFETFIVNSGIEPKEEKPKEEPKKEEEKPEKEPGKKELVKAEVKEVEKK